MPSKPTYLRDLADHPRTTAGEAAQRLRVNETAAAEAYRRARREGLVECDKEQPPRYWLTDVGTQKLPAIETGEVLSSNGSKNSAPVNLQSDVLARLDSIEGKLDDLEELVLRSVVDIGELSVLAEKLSPDEDSNSADEALLDLAEGEKVNPKLLELLSARSEGGRYLGKCGSRWEKIKALEAELGPEISEAAERLDELQRDLKRERDSWFPSDVRVEEIESEIAALREKLRVPAEVETEEGAEEAVETEE